MIYLKRQTIVICCKFRLIHFASNVNLCIATNHKGTNREVVLSFGSIEGTKFSHILY